MSVIQQGSQNSENVSQSSSYVEIEPEHDTILDELENERRNSATIQKIDVPTVKLDAKQPKIQDSTEKKPKN